MLIPNKYWRKLDFFCSTTTTTTKKPKKIHNFFSLSYLFEMKWKREEKKKTKKINRNIIKIKCSIHN